jgi:hypothetical protein
MSCVTRRVVISQAQYKMLEVFGLEMREITKAPQRGANKAAAGGWYGCGWDICGEALR